MSFSLNIERLYQKLDYNSTVLYHFDEDNEILFKIALPNKYGVLPNVEEIEGLDKVVYGDIFDYFEELKNLDIRYLNGIPTRIRRTYSGNCNNCGKNIGSLRYYSFKLLVDLCYDCYDEKKLESNWVQMYDTFEVQCSMCRKEINENVLNPFKIASNCLDYFDRYNLCQNCLKTAKGEEMIKEKGLRMVEYKVKIDQSRFGSLLDWVPIYKSNHDDEAHNMFVLYNINKESLDYDKLSCCSMDDHGRMGYYQFPEPYDRLGDSFKELIQKQLMRYYKVKDNFDKNGLEIYYSGPLQLAMAELGMMIHYE
jgi:RNA polymerase-binding transcription factor DksA